uniref:Uncharacterized protein n=1 Tax=Anguilla anguilla TaxID=7936 RepID=A0A0E9QSW7_ANGAN
MLLKSKLILEQCHPLTW